MSQPLPNVFSRETFHIKFHRLILIRNLNGIYAFDRCRQVKYIAFFCFAESLIGAILTLPADGGLFPMELRDITDCCVHLDVHEKRFDRDDLFELVFFQKDVMEWARILRAFLGEPVKPSGKVPTSKDLEITKGTGGIRIEQTLFEKNVENGTIIAKFWPWTDGLHITLRMALLPDSST
jgi:hypothetical protein